MLYCFLCFVAFFFTKKIIITVRNNLKSLSKYKPSPSHLFYSTFVLLTCQLNVTLFIGHQMHQMFLTTSLSPKLGILTVFWRSRLGLQQQQLSKQAAKGHTEGPSSLPSHWSGQAWKPLLSQSGGIWGTNANLSWRNFVRVCSNSWRQTFQDLPASSLSAAFPPPVLVFLSSLNCVN